MLFELSKVLIACAVNSLLVFFVPANECSNLLIHKLLNLIIIAIYVFDISLKIGYEGLKVIHNCLLYIRFLHCNHICRNI